MSKAWSNFALAMRRRGSAAGFDALVSPHLVRLYRLAYRFTGAPEDAEDLVQALLVKLIPQQQKLAQVEQLGPWLARSLYHLYVDQLRRRSISPLDLGDGDGGEALEALATEPTAPEDAVEQLLTQERVAAAVAQLPDEQRMLIAWHDIEGYTLEELADRHHIPIGTLKSRLHRARARLRRMLMQPFAASLRVRE